MDEKDRSIRILPTETYFTMVRRMLSESGSAYVRITGTSMLPLLRHLRDGVIIEPFYRQEVKTDIHTHPNPFTSIGTENIHNQFIHSDGVCKSSGYTLSDGTSLSDISASTLQSKPDGTPLNDISVSTQQINSITNTADDINPNTESADRSNRRTESWSPKSPRKLHRGDIVLYDRRNGRYALHRVIRMGKNGFTMAGDNQWHYETNLPYEQIVGVVTFIERDGKRISCKKLSLEAYSYYVALLTIPRILLYRSIRRLFKLIKRLFHLVHHPGT